MLSSKNAVSNRFLELLYFRVQNRPFPLQPSWFEEKKIKHAEISAHVLLFLVLFGLSSVNGYKLIDDNLEEGEDQNWNQGIGKGH